MLQSTGLGALTLVGAQGRTIACIEVGGSGSQTVIFAGGDMQIVDGAVASRTDLLLLAVPGIIAGDRVVAASNLGWFDVDPALVLGLGRSADLVLNDAEAAALGEAALREVDSLTFVGLGTGVGGAIVAGGHVVAANLFGHEPGFSEQQCRCGQWGCLETVAAGWALSDRIDPTDVERIAEALSAVLDRVDPTSDGPIVLTGGLVRNHPRLIEALGRRQPRRTVEPSAATSLAKSAAAWGLVRAVHDLDPTRS